MVMDRCRVEEPVLGRPTARQDLPPDGRQVACWLH
jgi:hypothetical protein